MRAYMYGFTHSCSSYLSSLPEAPRAPAPRQPARATPPGALLIRARSIARRGKSDADRSLSDRPNADGMFALVRASHILIKVPAVRRLLFEPIDHATFSALEARAARGEIVALREVLA